MAKKILFVLPWLKLGGLERVQVNIANALAERGYDVTVMALCPENDFIGELSNKVRYIYKPPKPHKIMRRIPYIRHKFYDDGMWETRASAKQLYKYYVGKEKYDVEIGFFRGLSVKIISGSTNKNSVKLAWVHSDFKKCLGITNNFKNIDATRRAYRKYDKIICVSDRARQGFEEVIGCADKTQVIYNLLPVNKIIELSKEPCEIKKDKFTIVTVGHLVGQKGFDRLINAAASLQKQGYDFDLWLVGYGEDEEKLKEIAYKNGATCVKFLGKKNNPYPYMAQADLYVCSSLYEGYNLTVAEALILGRPVLSTDCTGPTEILGGGEYGVIVENSEEGLRKGIKELLDNSDKLRYYIMRAKKRVSFFDEDTIVGKITALFKR